MNDVKGRSGATRWWIWAALGLILTLTAVVRVRFLDVPLERDEGEYAYAGQLILQGVPPYKLAYNMKLPGIYAAYAAVLAVFGQTARGIHLGLLVVNLATIILVFMLGRRFCGAVAALGAAGAFALLSLGHEVQGLAANSEHFVLLPAMAGVVLLVGGTGGRSWYRLAGAGLLLGLAFVVKQHGAVFAAFGGLYLVYEGLVRRPCNLKRIAGDVCLFSAAAALPFALTCAVLYWLGVFDKFWLWTFKYAGSYATIRPISAAPGIFWHEVRPLIGSAAVVWILVLLGMVIICGEKYISGLVVFARGAGKTRTGTNGDGDAAGVRGTRAAFLLGLLVFSFLAVCPGFYFRGHYFILLLPAVSLLAGVGLEQVSRGLGGNRHWEAPLIIGACVVGFTVFQQQKYIFCPGVNELSRLIYGGNPFPESLEVARYISSYSQPNDSIAVIGSEPQIYFYAKRRSATGHIYGYALMEDQPYALQMQEEMISQIEQARPKFLVFVSISTSWLAMGNSSKRIFEWFEGYQKEYYTVVGLVDIVSDRQTVYRWGSAAADYKPVSASWLAVLQRKADPPAGN